MNRYLPSLLFVLTLLFSSSALLAQWERQYPLEKLENVEQIAMHTDGYGYAVGDDDLILKLDPVSQTWNLVLSWDMNWSLNAVDYVNGTNGAVLAAGGQGLILSTNGGMDWTEIAGAPNGILDIHITSATDIIVVAVVGVFRWNNNIWTDLNLPVSSGVKGSCILDNDHLWVFTQGSSPTIYSTSNGGSNWSMNTDIPGPDVVRFYDAQYGVATDGRMIFKTLNGGTSWTMVSSNEIHNTSQDLAFGENANVMMSATNNGEPSITQDSGKTWTKFDMGTINAKNYSIAGVNDTEFWVGNDISSITHTLDGGLSWNETSGPRRSILYDTYFIDRNKGMSVGANGMILRSFDGGTHWEELDFDVTRTCFSVNGLTEDDVWMGANKGIFHTTNMGDTWEEKLSLVGGSVNDIVAVSASRILATTSTGQILRSTDGGGSWDTAYTAGTQFRSITRIDNQRLMATGFNGLILKSVDQGDTWNTITPPEAGLQYEKTNFIGEEGWMVTSSFKKVMWYSNNAGDTWSPIDLPIERFWEGLYFISPDTGIIAGRNNLEGRVYITFDGGQSWQGGHITSFPIYGVTGFPNPNGTAWIYGFGSNIEVLPYCNALPVIDEFTGNLNPCEKDTVLYTISATDVAQYFWTFPNGWNPVSDTNNDSIWVIAGKNAGLISVTGSNPCGISETIIENTDPDAIPTVSGFNGDLSPCESNIVTYSVLGTDVDQFIWNFPGDWNIVSDPTLSSVLVEIGSMSGEVSVQAINTCGSSAAIVQAVNPTLLAAINSISGELTPCEGSTVTYTADESNSESIVWTFPEGWENLNQNGNTIELKAGSMAGEITATGQNACGSSAAFQLDVSPLPAPPAFVIQNDNNLALSQSGSMYQWYLNGEVIDGATNSEYTALVSGEYYATILYTNGCEVNTLPVNVIVSSVWNTEDILSLSTYPNPVKEAIYLVGIEGTYDYQIFDSAGRIAIKNKSAESSVVVSSLTEGMYMIRIDQGDKIYQARFVILR